MEIGTGIRALRKAMGLSQEALARRANISLNVLNRIETGAVTDPHFSTLSRIAEGLGVPFGELLEEPAVPKEEAPSSPAEETSDEARRSADSDEDKADSTTGASESSPALDAFTAAVEGGASVTFIEAAIAFWQRAFTSLVGVWLKELEQRQGMELNDADDVDNAAEWASYWYRYAGDLAEVMNAMQKVASEYLDKATAAELEAEHIKTINHSLRCAELANRYVTRLLEYGPKKAKVVQLRQDASRFEEAIAA